MTDEQIIEFLLKNVDYMVNNNIVLMAVRAVSYTHLDVYKRQQQNGSGDRQWLRRRAEMRT